MFNFLEGRLMDEAGGADGGGLGGGADSGADLGGSPGTELAVIDAGDGGDGGDDDDAGQGGDDTALATRQVPTDDRGRLTKSAQAALAPLKQANPALHKLFYRNQGIVNRLKQMAPNVADPIAAWQADRQLIRSLAARFDGDVNEVTVALDQIAELDDLYMKADPRAIDIMTENPAGQSSMVKLLPHVIAKVEAAPGGPAAILGLSNKIEEVKDRLMPKAAARDGWRRVLGALKANGVDLAIKRMVTLIPKEDPIAAEAAIALSFLANLEAAASSTDVEAAPQPAADLVKKPDDTLSSERQQFEQEKLTARRENWAGASNSMARSTFERAWAELSKGKKYTAVDKENLDALVSVQMGIVRNNTAGYQQERNRLFKENDRAGFMKYMQDFYNRNVARVLKSKIATYGGGGQKPQAKAAVPGAPGQPKVTPQQGFKAVATQPPSNHIDHRPTATTRAMFLQQQASIKPEYRHLYGGAEKVQWAKKKV